MALYINSNTALLVPPSAQPLITLCKNKLEELGAAGHVRVHFRTYAPYAGPRIGPRGYCSWLPELIEAGINRCQIYIYLSAPKRLGGGGYMTWQIRDTIMHEFGHVFHIFTDPATATRRATINPKLYADNEDLANLFRDSIRDELLG